MQPPKLAGRWAVAGSQLGAGPIFGTVTTSRLSDGALNAAVVPPSEMTFFAALGLPLILAPAVGVHERYNARWATEAGAA